MSEQTARMIQVLDMADRLAEAAIQEAARVAKCKSDAERVADTIMAMAQPGIPKRGSYWWWVRLCRQYTGAHFLDSGGLTGYQYHRGFPPENGPHMWLNIWRGKPEYWSISLPAWLNTMLEADDEIAIALENVLMWAGEWLYPRENWYKITGDIHAILNMLYACIWEQGKVEGWRYSITLKADGYWHHHSGKLDDGKPLVALYPGCKDLVRQKMAFTVVDQRPHGQRVIGAKPIRHNPKQVFRRVSSGYDAYDMSQIHKWAGKGEVGRQIFAEWIVRYFLGKIYSNYDLKEYQRGMSSDEYIRQALTELPVKDVKLLHENEVNWIGSGWYSYGEDNDLDQDVHVDAEFEDSYGDQYLVLRTHNGADARGGFSDPVVAKYRDADYFRCYQVDGWCRNCDKDYYNMYSYDRAEEEKLPPVDAWRRNLQVHKAIEVGQLTFLPIEEWKWVTDLGMARAVVDYMDEEEERDYPAVVCGGKDGYWVPDADGGYETIPDDKVAGILCPKCGEYTVGFHSMVYGF